MKAYNKINEAVLVSLQAIVGEKNVVTDADKLVTYSQDEVTDSRYQHLPEAAVFPETAEQVAEIIKLANRELIPVTPRGAGTGLAAGAAPIYGGIVLGLEKMNKILEVNAENMYMVVEAGVKTQDVQTAAKEAGLLYAGDPSSGDNCFIGGNIATNAGGNKAIKYGTTRQQVYAIEIVTPTGEITELGGLLNKSTSGYSLEQLVIGSEGTLGIITKATLKLIPLPQYKMDLLAVFPDAEAAIDTVFKLLKAGVDPTSLEYMDNGAVKICARYLKESLPHQQDGNYLIITIETNDEDALDDKAVQIDEICNANGAIATLVPDSKKIWAARKAFGDAVREESYIHSSEDMVVPVKHLPHAMKEIAAICAKHSAVGRTVAHAGDGNIHLNILQGDIPAEAWPTKIDEILEELLAFTYRIGGKMSGEHGIGSKRAKWMHKFADPVQLKMMQAIKKAVDPNLILNPGTVFLME
ncbi:FAD-binding oxidoreductase [Sporomusa termitida]|uniref:Putative FAD-linked oxidoreductase n=1 Tax=Sporomusa termitida TaxID=2377 RepID=A0A517DW33_9FIRM|nr:FAD-binding oxidoreductase [Sporomusa termitida]QDR81570.1 putative FAD-linked oxidoreductase [Sporomusa termitida]